MAQEPREFEGRVALVTGGARGIGRETCLRLARGGAAIALNYVANDAAAAETKALVEAEGARCRLYKADCADPAAFGEVVTNVRRDLGPIGLLAANAGITQQRRHDALGFEAWRETIRVNLDGAFVAVQAVKDEMLAQGFGRIVCLSSIAALRPRELQIDYAAAKAGVIAMARCFAEALGPQVRVNCVAPGLTDTDMAAGLDPAMFPGRIAATPLKRIARPDEVAEAIAFLLSERSSFITGHTIVVSGGSVMEP